MKSRTAPCAPETPLQLQHYIASSLWKCFCFFVQGPWAPFRSIGIHHGFQGWKVEWKWSGFLRHETFMKPCFSFRQHPGLRPAGSKLFRLESVYAFFRLPNLSGMLTSGLTIACYQMLFTIEYCTAQTSSVPSWKSNHLRMRTDFHPDPCIGLNMSESFQNKGWRLPGQDGIFHVQV